VGGGVAAQAPRRKPHISTMMDRVKREMLFMLVVPPLYQIGYRSESREAANAPAVNNKTRPSI